MSKILLTGSRKFPGVPMVTDDTRNHTQVLQAVKEALEISQRRTTDVRSSHVRVQDLLDLGIAKIVGKNLQFNIGVSKLIDVELDGINDGDVLAYDAAQGLFLPVPQSGGGGGAVDSVNGQTGTVVLALDDVDDVDLAGAADGDVLTYDATYGLWLPEAPSAGGAGAWTKIASQTLGSPAATVTFGSIPQGYTSLYLTFVLNTSLNGEQVYMQFNGDTGANYDSAQAYGGTTSGSTIYLNNAKAEIISMPASDYSANQRISGHITIPYYSDTTFYKESTIHTGRRDAGGFYSQSYAHNWHNVAAITSLLLGAATNSFVAGSRFDLYGIE